MTLSNSVVAQAQVDGNDPERLEWLRDLGFGLFIHWSVDTQLGMDISHSLVGASDDYVQRYFDVLPGRFAPRRFDPTEWAELARTAGIRYVVFTSKHHNGFCMFHTATTDYQVANTPFERNITREVLDAFRGHGIAAGLYFSPDDFHWLWQNKIPIQRNTPEVAPANNPGLMELAKAQVTELLTDHGQVDMIFFDGPPEGLREHAWEASPGVLVTRGAIPTPEQYVPGLPYDGAWESNLTMGTQWTYKPTNESYKSGRRIIETLIETRAKGGNLLLNIGPRHDGVIPVEQEQLLQEIGLWMFVNSESIYDSRPWVITNEGRLWFTRNKDSGDLYVHVTGADRWRWGTRRDFVLASVRATEQTSISVLGQSGEVMEYRPGADPRPTFEQRDNGLHLSAMNTHRLYNDKAWPNPVVIKLTNVEPALIPPRIETVDAAWIAADGVLEVGVAAIDPGSIEDLTIGVEHQDITGLDTLERPDGWQLTAAVPTDGTGTRIGIRLPAAVGHTYAVRAVADAGLLTLRGTELKITAEPSRIDPA